MFFHKGDSFEWRNRSGKDFQRMESTGIPNQKRIP